MSDTGQETLVICLLKVSCYKYIKTIRKKKSIKSWFRSKIGYLNETKKEHTIQY